MAVARSEDMRSKIAMKTAITMTWVNEDRVFLAILISEKLMDRYSWESLTELYLDKLLYMVWIFYSS